MACMEGLFLCNNCGDMLSYDQIAATENVVCPTCRSKNSVSERAQESYGRPVQVKFEKTLLRCHLDTKYALQKSGAVTDAAEVSGMEGPKITDPIVDEECPKCGHPQMSYRAVQLRGLDEGQTIFYSCLNRACGHKFTLDT